MVVQDEEGAQERDMDFFEAISCVFNFREHEMVVYLDLVRHPRSTVDEMAQRLGRDRSWVQRALQTLLNLGIARRHRRLMSKGGYSYSYEAVPPQEARRVFKGSLERWHAGVIEEIDRCFSETAPGEPPSERKDRPRG